jgi:hypothetical protein
MASAIDWSDAYLAQAREDLNGVEIVAAGGIAPSVTAMMFQMVFEKLAKAALLRTGAITIDYALSSHEAALVMVQVLRLQRGIMAPLGGPKVWQDALWAVEHLVQAHPHMAKRTPGTPQLEYPWECSDGSIQWPAKHLAIARAMARSNLSFRLLSFATLLERHFDEIFERNA